MRVVGLDLAGNPSNATGYCILHAEKTKTVQTRTLHSDEEILSTLSSSKPDLVAVDAPLVYDGQRRLCDDLLRQYGALPVTLPGMEVLAKRGSSLAAQLSERKLPAIEVYANASARILGVYSKKDFTMQKSMMGLSLEGDINSKILTRDELDSVLAALTGYLHLAGQTEKVGQDQATIIVPKV